MVLVNWWKVDEESKKMVLTANVSELPLEVAEFLLDSWEDVKITHEMIAKAIGNPTQPVGLVTSLLNRSNESVTITYEMVLEAIRNRAQPVDLTKFLLDRSEGKVEISHEMIETALGNGTTPVELTKFLLSRRRDDVKITQEMVEEATGNRKNTMILAQVLLSQGRQEAMIAPENFDTVIERNRETMKWVELLLDELDEGITITEKIVKFAYLQDNEISFIECFLRRRRKDLPIAASAVKYVLRHFPRDVVQILLDHCEFDNVFTKETIKGIGGRLLGAKDMILSLIDQRRDVIDRLLDDEQEAYAVEKLGRNLYRINFRYEGGWIYYKWKEDRWEIK
ncbi:hypothetical protein COCCADRAFT_3518 [Bipolaris zeicola 26-R-13]|uniref:HEAT repeat domain-containing protein n=1 Tax=Cochliobolus carbonum (strain 26-R-13) TaxID=930089 RepID=W6YC92_COCC2|nr:uncharacterized protein COCCADRAFT_3518 [Bipolaris zeicola 26-R-13]EUC35245.1 hypothetical protein COCCADRAFT_3518 [Bipolaris zeicola 26-R-13]